MLLTSTSASNTSVGANVSIKKPTPDEAQRQEVSSSSESDTQLTKKENVDVMVELNVAATNDYPHIPAVKNNPLIIKIHEVLRQEVLEKLSVRYRFGGINPAVWKITEKRFRRELSRNEAHSSPT